MASDSDMYVGPRTAPDAYRLISLIGSGPGHEIWRATTGVRSKADFAILITESVDDPQTEAAWDVYAHLLRAIDHPNIVRVRATFASRGKHVAGNGSGGHSFRCVVMDYVAGSNLATWIESHPDAAFADRHAILAAVASALDELHTWWAFGAHAAHGAVSPANIVVAAGGAPILVGLGLRSSQSDGATSFAAPELRGTSASPTVAGDAFSFGATAVQTFTGRIPPTDGGGAVDVGALNELLSSHPATSERPTLRRHLAALLSEQPEARPTRLLPAIEERRRRGWLVAAAAAAVLLVAGGAAIAASSTTHTHGNRPVTGSSPQRPALAALPTTTFPSDTATIPATTAAPPTSSHAKPRPTATPTTSPSSTTAPFEVFPVPAPTSTSATHSTPAPTHSTHQPPPPPATPTGSRFVTPPATSTTMPVITPTTFPVTTP